MRTSFCTSALAALPTMTLAQQRPNLANTSAVPTHYGILLTPSITPLDMFGPMDVFQGLAMAFLNVTGPMHLSIISVNSTPSTTNPPMAGIDFGMALPPSVTTGEYLAAAANNFTSMDKSKIPGPLDVLLVPGGGGTRKDVSHEIDFVRTVYPSLKHLISVCTGSTILARAGVFDGRKATTNKKAWAWATSFGNNVTYVPHARWVQDGNVWSSSGVSAGIDVSYAFLASVYGENVSQWVADVSEYTRWTNASYDPFADRWGPLNMTALS
jgi:putative intracellular protease/amidase